LYRKNSSKILLSKFLIFSSFLIYFFLPPADNSKELAYLYAQEPGDMRIIFPLLCFKKWNKSSGYYLTPEQITSSPSFTTHSL